MAYRRAVASFPHGRRVLVAAFTVDGTQPVLDYHATGNRPDARYRRARVGQTGPVWTAADGNRWQLRSKVLGGPKPEAHSYGGVDLAGACLRSRRFVRYPADLRGAPRLPAAVMQMFRSWNGRFFKELPETVAQAARAWLGL